MATDEATYIRRMLQSYDDNNNDVLDREEFYKVIIKRKQHI